MSITLASFGVGLRPALKFRQIFSLLLEDGRLLLEPPDLGRHRCAELIELFLIFLQLLLALRDLGGHPGLGFLRRGSMKIFFLSISTTSRFLSRFSLREPSISFPKAAL